MPNPLEKILQTDQEHQLLFNMFFDNWNYTIDYSNINYKRLFFLIVNKHRILNHFFDKADLLLFPNEFVEKLKKARLKQKQRALRQLGILHELRNLLKDYDFIVLKGLPLSQQLYKDFSYRDSSDVDILIKPEQEQQILELLSNNGFKRAFNYEHHYVLKRFGISVEIHRKLSAIFNTSDIERTMWKSNNLIKINNIDFRVANSNEIYNYYLINASTHYLKRFSYWIELVLMKRMFNYSLYPSCIKLEFIFDDILLNRSVNTYTNKLILDNLFNTEENNILITLKRLIYFAKISNYSLIKTFYKRSSFFILNKLMLVLK